MSKITVAHNNKFAVDFTKIGGLNDHINLLKDLIILPLLYSNVFTHFGIKAARGVLFHGPPGTGKTLIAAALANELMKEGYGKVQFYARKGADILDKWVGGSEKKLNDLFDKAKKNRPAIIFFDELDGLAPARSQRNDQVHSSIVATLLALMDGLNITPGVVVIGATNRLDVIDPALRRPGRFDKELYFSIPCTISRKEILQVHVQHWPCKPSSDLLTYLAELTTGFTGSDLQALCSEAFLCGIKRCYPNVNQHNSFNKVNINKHNLKIEECDFFKARLNIIPSTQRTHSRIKKLSPCIRPLLQRQLNKILCQLEIAWPHFTTSGYKFFVDVERYTGRLLLVGSSGQGLNNHVVPAFLQALEHLPVEIIDAAALIEKILPCQKNIASIILFSRINDWWDLLDEIYRNALITFLEDMHPSKPMLLICTCDGMMPEILHSYFSMNSAIIVHMENPTREERENFFRPLFFDKDYLSFEKVLQTNRNQSLITNVKQRVSVRNYDKIKPPSVSGLQLANGGVKKTQRISRTSFVATPSLTKRKRHLNNSQGNPRFSHSFTTKKISTIMNDPVLLRSNISSNSKITDNMYQNAKKNLSLFNNSNFTKIENFTTALTNLINSTEGFVADTNCVRAYSDPQILLRTMIKKELCDSTTTSKIDTDSNCAFGDSEGIEKGTIQNLFERTIQVTSDNWTVSRLELLYDALVACLRINNDNFTTLVQNMDKILSYYESGEVTI